MFGQCLVSFGQWSCLVSFGQCWSAVSCLASGHVWSVFGRFWPVVNIRLVFGVWPYQVTLILWFNSGDLVVKLPSPF